MKSDEDNREGQTRQRREGRRGGCSLQDSGNNIFAIHLLPAAVLRINPGQSQSFVSVDEMCRQPSSHVYN